MAKLAYYASPVPDKKTWVQTDEGYRIYTQVPICRTGSQFYFGNELKKNQGYKPAWGLNDDQQYEVFRPLKEVTDPATIASFEGKSVLDQHPSDKVLIDALDEYDGVSQGHIQNVRVGRPLPSGEFAGETPLLADVHVKNPELNLKIENGIREVSCGYRFLLAKDETGRLTMTKIRGNHLAVVPRGRAGAEIAIGDAASEASTNSTETRKRPMDSRTMRAIGFQTWCKTATPEQVAEALEQFEKGENVLSDESNETADAWSYDPMSTDGAHRIFDPEIQDPSDKSSGVAGSWPKSAMTSTSVEILERQAKLQDKQDEGSNRLGEFDLEDMGSAADAQPRVMDFYAGRPFAEGRKLHNAARAARGLAPIPEGRR
jgi:hypothetical protein